MTLLPPQSSSVEPRQEALLRQWLEYQQAMKKLFEQLPDANIVLTKLLLEKIQTGFVDHPRPIALEEVTCEEGILITDDVGHHIAQVPHSRPLPLSALFNSKPWGGEHHDAPNRFYRFYTKASYQAPDNSVQSTRKVHRTSSGSPAFEQFMNELISRPDRCYQRQLDRFWSTPGGPETAVNRGQWLASALKKALLTEAQLRVEDGTLATADAQVLRQVIEAASRPGQAAPPIRLKSVACAVGLKGQNGETDITLTRVLMIRSETPGIHAAVILHTPDKGLDTFATVQEMEQSLTARISSAPPQNSLLNTIAWKDQPRAQRYLKNSLGFSFLPINGDIFAHQVGSLLTLQKQDIEHGWNQLNRYETDGQRLYEMFNRLAHLGPLLDLSDLAASRAERFIDHNVPAWYKNASHADQREAERLMTAQVASNNALQLHLQKIPVLSVFTRDTLKRQLREDFPGKVIEPDTVTVTITTGLNPQSQGGGIGPDHVASTHADSHPTYTSTMSLVDMALKNNDPWDFGFYKLFTGESTRVSAVGTDTAGLKLELSESYLSTLVHKVNIGQAYDELLQRKTLTDGAQLRAAWVHASRASMASNALLAQLSGDALLEDRENRGYQWIKAIVDDDNPTYRRTVGGHAIVTSTLVIANTSGSRNGYGLTNILMISAEQRNAVASVILYTPGAPGEHMFRQFSDIHALQDYLQHQWHSSPVWRNYLMQQLPLEGQLLLTESKLHGTKLRSHLLLNSQSRIGNPFEFIHTQLIAGPLHDALYERVIKTLRLNANHESTSNAEVDEQSGWNKINFGVNLALNLLPTFPVATVFSTLNSVGRLFLLLKQLGSSSATARALWSISGARGVVLAPRLGTLPRLGRAPVLPGPQLNIHPLQLQKIADDLYRSHVTSQQYALIDGKYYVSETSGQQRYLYAADQKLHVDVTWQTQPSGWKTVPGLRLAGGMEAIERGPMQTTYADYELPLADLAAVPELRTLQPGSLSLDTLQQTLPANVATAALHLFAIQARLRRHARAFLRTFSPPPRHLVLPPRDSSVEALINHLSSQNNGLVIGEDHLLVSARRFIIDNMATFKARGVTRLYLELMSADRHQVHLDSFNASATGQVPPVLNDLWRLGRNALTPGPHYDYFELAATAHAHGVRLMALDITASALLTPYDLIAPNMIPSLADQLDRLTTFNFFAYKKIIFDQAREGPHGWVALVGMAHGNTFQGIPGLAELTGASSVRISTRLPNLPPRVNPDPGILLPSPMGTHHNLLNKNDLLLLLADQQDLPLDSRIYSPDQFGLIAPSGVVTVRYMNPRRQIVEVPVLGDNLGIYVTHTAFAALSNRRFNNLAALADALSDELQMIEV